MNKPSRAALAASLLWLATGRGAAAQTSGVAAYRKDADRIVAAATADRSAWNRLAELTDTFGPRLSGSASLEGALRWAEARMKEDGLENVRLEPVNQLGDVRTNAAKSRSQVAERQRLPCLGQLSQSALFRHREPKLVQRALELVRYRLRGMHQGKAEVRFRFD